MKETSRHLITRGQVGIEPTAAAEVSRVDCVFAEADRNLNDSLADSRAVFRRTWIG